MLKIMELNLLDIILAIIIVISVFSISYYCFLVHRYKKARHLILDQDYLAQIFQKSSSKLEASQDSNGDISITTVTFEEKDFRFSAELNAIEKYFQSIEGEV